ATTLFRSRSPVSYHVEPRLLPHRRPVRPTAPGRALAPVVQVLPQPLEQSLQPSHRGGCARCLAMPAARPPATRTSDTPRPARDREPGNAPQARSLLPATLRHPAAVPPDVDGRDRGQHG